MTFEEIIKWLLGAVAALLGLWNVDLQRRIGNLEKDVKEIPDTYARRDDVRDGFAQLSNQLQRIEDRLYGKGNS